MRVELNGTVSIIDESVRLANDLGFAPDGRTLYLADSAARLIFAYDYSVETGAISRRREFVAAPREEGLPDGLTVDAEGHVWCAHWFGGAVVRYDPEGRVAARLAVPASQTSSIAFGGPDMTDIFITSASLPDALPLAPPEYDPAVYTGGRLYHANAGVRGKPEFQARINQTK